MGVKLKSLREQVIVITGASSGIGRVTAEIAADRGARVVLAARTAHELDEIVEGIRRRGGQARAVVADVADESQVQAIADAAVAEFGGFDTWVNNAGVSIYGRSTEVPMADKRRLFDVNFWGVVYGCKTAVDHLRTRGGALINVGSIVSDIAIPMQGIYSASKHAVKGYTNTLRMELEEEGLPISVTLIKPGPIDTPYPQHARNYMEHEPKHVPPVYPPEEVAYAILKAAERPIREVVVGGAPRLQRAFATVAPRLTELVMEKTMVTGQQRPETPWSDDSLYSPSSDGLSIRGVQPGRVMRSSAYTRAVLSDAARAVPMLAIGAIAAAVVFARR